MRGKALVAWGDRKVSMCLTRAVIPTCGSEHSGIHLHIALGEALHHSVNLLRLAGQPETPQELSAHKRGTNS